MCESINNNLIVMLSSLPSNANSFKYSQIFVELYVSRDRITNFWSKRSYALITKANLIDFSNAKVKSVLITPNLKISFELILLLILLFLTEILSYLKAALENVHPKANNWNVHKSNCFKSIIYRSTWLGNTIIIFVIKQICWTKGHVDLTVYYTDIWWNVNQI